MKNLIYTFVLLTFVMFSSCSKETIDSTPHDFAQARIIVADSVKIVQFVNNIYTLIPTGYNRLSGPSMVASATDEAVNAARGSGAELWGTGSWGPSALYDGVTTLNIFSNSYTGIRRTFDYEEQIKPLIQDFILSPATQNILLGQVLFLRAFYNFEILKRFGGYPIVLKALQVSDNLNIPRSTYDASVKYISDLCDQAAALLPVTYVATDLGRATKGAALALKARLLLYAASPLFNDPAKTADHVEHGAYDATKWAKAAAASAAVINLKNGASSVYSLYANYDAFFYTLTSNNEIILSQMTPLSNTVESANGPAGYTGGQGGTCPSLDLVNDYEMKTGIPFDWNNPVHAAKPFANRDPRFGKSILFNDTTWMTRATTLNKIQTYVGLGVFPDGADIVGNKATRTSFYLRKFLNITASWNAPVSTTYHCWPLFRYGEVLLNYAEAMNEAYGPDVDPQGFGMTARAAITLIRTRAGLAANKDVLLNAPAGDQAKMRTAIRHERRIELAFEEHRYLDLRRWKTDVATLTQPVHGLTIVKTGATTFTYTPIVVEQRAFDPKMYLYPFPQDEMNRNSGLVQNTGW